MEILGWIANGLFFLGGGFKNPRKTIAAYMTADILYVLVYASLDLYLGAIAMGITALRSGLTIVLNEKLNFYSLIILTTILCFFTAAKADALIDLTLLFGTIAIGLSGYYRDHFVKFRILTSISQILWIIHALTYGVYSMVFCCMIILGTNVGALLYYSELGKSLTAKLAVVKK